jgi:hypothetical protein
MQTCIPNQLVTVAEQAYCKHAYNDLCVQTSAPDAIRQQITGASESAILPMNGLEQHVHEAYMGQHLYHGKPSILVQATVAQLPPLFRKVLMTHCISSCWTVAAICGSI